MEAGIKNSRALQAWTEYLQTRSTLEWLDDAGILIQSVEAPNPIEAVEDSPSVIDGEQPQAA